MAASGSARAPGEVRERGSTGYSAPAPTAPLATSIGLSSASPSQTPASTSLCSESQRSGGVHAWPCGRNAANQGQPGPRALRQAPGGLGSPWSTSPGRRGGGGRPPAAAPRPAPLGPRPLPTRCSDTAERATGRGFQGFRAPGSTRAEEGVSVSRRLRLSSPAPPPRSLGAPAPASLTLPGPGSAAARRRRRITGEPGAPARLHGSRGEGALSFPSPRAAVTHADEEMK